MKDVKSFIRSKIAVEDYKILSKNMSIGNVYKIENYGKLNVDGYECGFLYLPKGSSVIPHTHTDDIEQYMLVSGKLSINGIEQQENICMLGETHSIDTVPVDTIIATCKVDKKLFEFLDIPVSAKIFDWFKQNENSFATDEIESSKVR